MEKITYASLGLPGDDFHRAFDLALVYEQKRLGRTHAPIIRGQKKKGKGSAWIDTHPADTRVVLGEFQGAGREEARQAIDAARGAVRDWEELGWPQRVAFLRKAAALLTERQFRAAAVLSLETGKNRLEAIAEVNESVDLILYYCRQVELHHGYTLAMGGNGQEATRSVLRPYGVWAVMSPFSFPLAVPAGMASAALLGGNTVILKPSTDAPLAGVMLHELLHEAGLPVGVVNYLPGAGAVLAEEFVANAGLDGLAFAGGREAGLDLSSRFKQQRLRPCVVEMGGKNPVIVMPSANLDDAAEGVVRSAFGFCGQKSAACSRLYVHQQIYKPFMELLVDKAGKLVIGDPLRRDTALGPLINVAALGRYELAVRLARKEGRIRHGGNRLKQFEHGCFVEPAIVDQVPAGSRLCREEIFAPVLVVTEVKSLADAIRLSNDTEYGLSAGIFTQEEHEQETFFASIEAGVAYANRRGGATTGAWPGVQSFCGWRSSASSGKGALGPYYVPQFLREQSQTRLKLRSS